MRNSLAMALCASAVALTTGIASAQQKTTLTVYTALETDAMKLYKDGFEKANPDIEVRWVRDSTGIVTARLLAEKANPQADVIAGLAASSLVLLSQEGMLQGYEPKGFQQLSASYSDTARPPQWVGMDVWAATICFNRVEAQKLGLPKPESWKDLAKPIYKGRITMPHPASSGTGYLDVAAWLQMWGEPMAGSTWTACTRTSPSMCTPVPSRASRRRPANSRSASRSSFGATRCASPVPRST